MHTKAPWKVVENGGRMVGVMSKNDWVVYKAGQDRMSTEEIEANACLIAAAPDLLSDLVEAAQLLRNYEKLHREKGTEDGLIKADRNKAWAEQFEATINKATSISN